MKKILPLAVLALAIVALLFAGSTSAFASSSAKSLSGLEGLKGVDSPIINLTWTDFGGNPYCDGVSIDVNGGGDLSVHGTQCGCLTDPAYGAINYTVGGITPTGVGAGLGFTGAYAGLYFQMTFNPPGWTI